MWFIYSLCSANYKEVYACFVKTVKPFVINAKFLKNI